MNKLLCMVVCATLTGCTTTHQKQEVIQPEKVSTLFIQNVDLSRSTSQLSAYNDSSVARNIYYILASQGKATIKVIYIGTNSKDEEVITIPVISLDTVKPDTIRNTYLRSKALRNNKAALEKFNEQAEGYIQKYIAGITRPRDQQYSDVSGALALTAATLRQSNFQGHRKIVAIFSDLVHCPKDRKSNKLEPVQFENTTILGIRPALAPEQLNKLFAQEVQVLTSSQDVLLFLQSNQSNQNN